jgi:hypothetical protein
MQLMPASSFKQGHNMMLPLLLQQTPAEVASGALVTCNAVVTCCHAAAGRPHLQPHSCPASDRTWQLAGAWATPNMHAKVVMLAGLQMRL